MARRSVRCHSSTLTLSPRLLFLGTPTIHSYTKFQAEVNASVDQLKRLTKTKTKKPRDSIETINAKLKELEDKRTRTSLPLSEEKAILKQIDSANRSKRQLDEYKAHNRSIAETRAKLDGMRDPLRATTSTISELEKELGKIELAKRCNCNPTDLKYCAIDCPEEKLGFLIGKNGATIRQIEERASVQIDIDRRNSKVHLKGSEDALKIATREVEAITLAVEKEMSVSKAAVSYIMSSKVGSYVLLNLAAAYNTSHNGFAIPSLIHYISMIFIASIHLFLPINRTTWTRCKPSMAYTSTLPRVAK